MKVALLSNINVDPINRQLKSLHGYEIYESQGYGNELGTIINKQSPLYSFGPDMVFLIMDVMELIQHNIEVEAAEKRIDEWFSILEAALSDNIIFYISDAYLYGFEMDVVWDKSVKPRIEARWNDDLQQLVSKHSNVRAFSYSTVIQHLGEDNAFSNKMWYMGKILYSASLQRSLAEEITQRIAVETRQAKKVLLLDLDNTIWRGLAGENDITPIVLSEDGVGLAYKNFQRVIKLIKQQGVVLGIVSKNNESDAISLIANHPHMVLRPDDFAAVRINWKNKAENITEIAKELNIGLDSIVFVDDNKAEQTLIKETLPDVVVPDFPDRPENLSGFMTEIYIKYFEKAVLTDEDREKTNQYQANRQRKELQESSVNYDGYLDGLEMKMFRVDPERNIDRFIQLVNKTNQFNLTTRRLTEPEAFEVIQNPDSEVFLYRVMDRFGDNGIVAAVIVDYGEDAVITEFTMSCRVMGRKIEDAIIGDVEESARKRGYNKLIGIYRPTEKNKPVKNLYSSLGYKTKRAYEDGEAEYSIELNNALNRIIHVEKMKEE